MVSLELLIALSLTCVVQMSLSFFVLFKFRHASLTVSGSSTDEVVEDIPLLSIQGESMSLAKLVHQNRHTKILIVDADCQECKKIITSSKYLNDAVLSGLTVIFTYNEKEEEPQNMQQISSYSWIRFKYMSERSCILQKLRVGFFPFYIEMDQSGRVVYKGLASIDVILERLHVASGIQANI